jgi:hypothetical protein
MYTTYHFSSAQELNADILDSIKATFKMKPITIIVEEEEYEYVLNTEMKNILDERLQEDEATYLTSEESINQLDKKYGL